MVSPDLAVTFDFHNTLIQCDEWFDLEVHHVASEYLRWQGRQQGVECGQDVLLAADATYRALRLEIMDHGEELSAEDGVREVLRRLDIEAMVDHVDVGVAELMQVALNTVDVMPGARATAEYLHLAGVKMGIVSSAVYHSFLVWALERMRLTHLFPVVTTSASTGFYKSRPEIFLHAAQELGVAAGAVTHVGDSFRWDVLGARRAGMRSVWVQHPGHNPVPGESPADLTVATLVNAGPEILQLLQQKTA